MPALAEKFDLDPCRFKGAKSPSIVRFERGSTYFYRQLTPDTKEYRTRAIKGASNMQEAIEKAHIAFLEIRQLPKKTKKRKKGSYDSGYVDAKSWEDYKLPTGGIYVFTTDFDSIKIGRTNDFRARFKTHQCSNPENIKVLCLISAETEDVRTEKERELHQRCSKYCRVNEWFWYVPTVQNMILDLQEEYNFEPFTYGRKPPGFD